MKQSSLRTLIVILSLVSAGANWHECSPLRVIDGDTLAADVRLDFGIVLADERLRIVGFDAPELNEAGGADAKTALARLLAAGCQASPGARRNRSRDSFGRLLVHLWVKDTGDVASEMRRRGHEKKR